MFLNLVNISFFYNKNEILNNINLNLNKGEIAIIIGESGSGKTTILKLINGLLSPSSGKIFFKDKDIFNYNPTFLRKKICYIPQTSVAIAENVFSEFKMVKKDINKEEVLALIYEFKLNDKILEVPMNNLSIGQQQRISILRSIINKPEIMLLDEPTSALDEENIAILEDIIKNLNKKFNITFIIVTHNLQFANDISKKKFLLRNKQLQEI